MGSALTDLAIGSQESPSVESLELRFGPDLNEKHVEAVLTGIAALPRGVKLTFDCVSDEFGVRHFAHGSKRAIEMLSSRLRGVVPSVRLDPTSSCEEFTPTSAARVTSTHRHLLFKEATGVQTVAALLAALTEPLDGGERLLLRVTVQATPAPRLPADGSRPFLERNRVPKRHVSRLQSKYDGPLLATQSLVAAKSHSVRRSDAHLRRVVEALRACRGELGRLGGKRTSTRAAQRTHRELFPRWQALSPVEVTSLLGWPVGAPDISGVRIGAGPTLPVPRSLPSDGRQFGSSTAPQTVERPIVQPIEGSLQHSIIVGGTGSGKTTLVSGLIRQDMTEGRGCLVVDLKGDLIDDLLEQIPADRKNDVVLLDPSSKLDQPGLRLFPPGQVDVDLSADVVLSTLQEVFSESSWGVRSSQYFRLGLVTLGSYEHGTLTDLPRLFHDRQFRANVIAHVTDKYVLAAWQRFESLSSAEQLQQLASPMTKLEQLVGRRSLRSVLGQPQPKLHFGEALARNRIVFVRLSPGQLGAPATRLLAGIVMWQFFSAVEARSELPPKRRTPFLAYVDEVAALGALPLPLEGLLERARGLGVGVTLSPQAISQLPKPLQAAALANVGTFLSFRQSSMQEAKTAASVLPGVEAGQLAHLERFEFAARLSLGPGAVSPVVTGRSTPLPPPVSDADEIRGTAAKNWGGRADEPDAQDMAEADRTPVSNSRRRGS
ncbi:MAG: type IV secretory system conjugative DNA transfer family protein [Solirubrobacterales bacterium]